MSSIWRCAVCEAVNQGGRSCSACGAPLTRRSAVVTSVRDGMTPSRRRPPPIAKRPLSEPVRRAINREYLEPDEWEIVETAPRFDVMPLPGGCLFSLRHRRRRSWW